MSKNKSLYGDEAACRVCTGTGLHTASPEFPCWQCYGTGVSLSESGRRIAAFVNEHWGVLPTQFRRSSKGAR